MSDAIRAMPEENASGMGKFHEVPGDVEGWSWGAFFWTWLWAIPNCTWGRCLVGEIARMDVPRDCRYDLVPALRFP
jgi:hypothetical protein